MDTLEKNIDEYYKDQIAMLRSMILELTIKIHAQKEEIKDLQELLRSK